MEPYNENFNQYWFSCFFCTYLSSMARNSSLVLLVRNVGIYNVVDGNYNIGKLDYSMNKTSFHILRVGMAITFLWIGILIFKDPASWAGYLQPWAANLLPVPIERAMMGTAFLDVIIGLILLLDWKVWWGALLAAMHLTIVLVTSGITDITARDIGLLAGAIALMASTWPPNFISLKTKSYE